MGGTAPGDTRGNLSITFSFHEDKTGFPASPGGWAVDVLSRLPFSAAQQKIGSRGQVWRVLAPRHCRTVTEHTKSHSQWLHFLCYFSQFTCTPPVPAVVTSETPDLPRAVHSYPMAMHSFFVSFHVHVLFFFLSFICFLSPFDFLLFYSRALAVNVRSLTLVIMHKCPRVLGVRGLGNTMGLLTCERCTVEVLWIFPHLWHGCLQLHGGCSKWPRGSIPLNWVLKENMWMGSHCFKSFAPNLAHIHCQGVVMRNIDSRLVKDYGLELCKHERERTYDMYVSVPGD